MAQDIEITRLQWALNQDLLQIGATLERLRVLSTLGFFDDGPAAEHQRAARVLGAYADTLACFKREVHTADEATILRARIEGNLALVTSFLAHDPAYLREPEFSVMLRQTVLASAEKGGSIEEQREVGS